jgi:hypothetical protein
VNALIANGVTFNRDIHWATEQAYKNGYEDGKRDAFAKDNNVPSKWIPVTERLPEIRKWVLIYTEIGRTLVAAWYGDGWGTTSFVALNNVTHWMPLPETPKDGEGS